MKPIITKKGKLSDGRSRYVIVYSLKGKRCSVALIKPEKYLKMNGIEFDDSKIEESRPYVKGYDRKKVLVMVRDDFVCRICGRANALHVHHIDGNSNNSSSSNLITLCSKCHKKLHLNKIKLDTSILIKNPL